MKYSLLQEAVFDWVKNGTGSAVVEAVAGSGKTTTIVETANRVPNHFRCVFLAFNKSIAEELKSRLPAHVDARTMNSLGAGICFKNAGKVPLEADKLARVVKETILKSEVGEDGLSLLKYPLQTVIKRMRNLGIKPDELVGETWDDIRAEVLSVCDDLDPDLISAFSVNGQGFFEYLSGLARKTIEAMMTAPDMDFDDQIYMPIYHGWKGRPYDLIFVDESQDLSPANRKLLRLVSNRYTRFCFVGDARQAIYAFRGADSRSLQIIKEEFNARSFPLSICYRCPKDVIRLAQVLAPEIQYFEERPDGVVMPEATMFRTQDMQRNDLIVCRLNAPLVRAAMRLAKAGTRCVILGRDFGRTLSNIIRQLKVKKIDMVPAAVKAWSDRKVSSLIQMGKDEDSVAVQEVRDKQEAIQYFFDELHPTSVDGFCDLIEQRFSDKDDGQSVVLATIHKAKGKEYDRVFVLEGGKIGSFRAKRGDDQEANLMYVAVTRAKKELRFVDIDQDPEKKPSALYLGMVDRYRQAKSGQAAPVAGLLQPSTVGSAGNVVELDELLNRTFRRIEDKYGLNEHGLMPAFDQEEDLD